MRNIMNFDIISPEVGFYINGSKFFKSFIGTFFSLILFLLTLIGIIILGKDLFNKENPKLVISQEIIKDVSISMNDLYLHFTVQDINGNFLKNINDYFSFVVFKSIMKNQKIEKMGYENITVNNCNYDYFKNSPVSNRSSEIDISITFCIQDPSKNLNLVNEHDSPNSENIVLFMEFCDSNINKCPNDLDFLKNFFIFRLFTLNSIEDNSDYKNPIKYIFTQITSFSSIGTFKMISLDFLRKYYNTDVGWLIKDFKEISYLNLEKRTDQLYLTIPTQVNTAFRIHLGAPQLKTITFRSYSKIQNLVADIGGLINGLIILIRFTVQPYLKHLFRLELINLSEKENIITNFFQNRKKNIAFNQIELNKYESESGLIKNNLNLSKNKSDQDIISSISKYKIISNSNDNFKLNKARSHELDNKNKDDFQMENINFNELINSKNIDQRSEAIHFKLKIDKILKEQIFKFNEYKTTKTLEIKENFKNLSYFKYLASKIFFCVKQDIKFQILTNEVEQTLDIKAYFLKNFHCGEEIKNQTSL